MSALTLIVTLLVGAAGDCYLVTNKHIKTIPCDFDASTTDALRYAAENDERTRGESLDPRGRVVVPWSSYPPRYQAFGHGPAPGFVGR